MLLSKTAGFLKYPTIAMAWKAIETAMAKQNGLWIKPSRRKRDLPVLQVSNNQHQERHIRLPVKQYLSIKRRETGEVTISQEPCLFDSGRL